MKPKRILALILCAVLIASALYGCNSDADVMPPVDPPSENNSPSEGAFADDHRHAVDLEAAFAAFAPETTMIIAGELEVTWAKLFFLLCSNINTMISTFGAFPDLSLTVPDGRTYAEALLDYAADNALRYLSFEYGAMVLGVTLSEEEQEMLDTTFESMVEMFGDVETLCDIIWNINGVCNLELFLHLIYLDYLPLAIFYNVFGENGEHLSDEDLSEFTADNGYLMAKHILRMTTEDDDEAPLREIKDILFQLNNYDGDDLNAFFDELMFEHSEDQGALSMFPDGYLFQHGDMEEPFYEATAALEIGAFSGIVETENGYHIILRLPIDFDAVPISSLFLGDDSSLRLIAALDMFDIAASEWRDSLSPVFTTEYKSIDIATLFVPCDD